MRRWAPPAAIAEIRSGDAVLIAADDPVALAQTARHLMDAVYQAPGHPRLRIALHYGPVQTDRRGANQRTVIVGGDAILCAARVEPLVEAGPDLGDRGLPPAVPRAAVALADDGGAGAGRRRPLQHQEARLVRARRLDVPLPARVLIVAAPPQIAGQHRADRRADDDVGERVHRGRLVVDDDDARAGVAPRSAPCSPPAAPAASCRRRSAGRPRRRRAAPGR